MKTSTVEIIGQTFQEVADMVTPTMGAKGRMAIISDEFSRPYLTDDGVTVARECLHFEDPFKKMVATSIIEASNNTEKTAFDGTTLTVLMTNELYKAGKKLIDEGMHPQTAADLIKSEVTEARRLLGLQRIAITDETAKLTRDVANITTKMPAIGELVYNAYKIAGSSMNIIIEHDRKNTEHTVEHVDGMVIDSGYFSPELRQLCNEDGEWIGEDTKLFLLSEGIITRTALNRMFASMDLSKPYLFVVDKNFNPESLKLMMDNLVSNKIKFMFMFINDSRPDEIFLDIAAKTNGKIQSPTLGTTDYLFEYAGTASKVIVEQDKTTIFAEGNPKEIVTRLADYKRELKENEYNTGYVRADVINRRMSNLDRGVTKIKIATPSITEYRTIRFKLDDAIGAVRCACRDGVVLGAGKALWLVSNTMLESDKEIHPITDALKQPTLTIQANAGTTLESNKKNDINDNERCGLDVKTGLVVNLYEAGIVDSFTSIDSALANAESIATSYLRAFILINKEAK